MPEGGPKGGDPEGEQGTLFSEDAAGKTEKPVSDFDPVKGPKEIGEAVAAADERRKADDYNRQFWLDRGEIPPDPEPRTPPYDELGGRPDRQTKEMVRAATTRRMAPAAHAALDAALAAGGPYVPPEPLVRVDDPHAPPAHSPERRVEAARQVDEFRDINAASEDPVELTSDTDPAEAQRLRDLQDEEGEAVDPLPPDEHI